jgi:phosphoribosylaminoimidazolecarboxamide formyltransferase/IMP cyclohydrolase
MKRFALLSVSNKDGIIEFAKTVTDNGYDILATGNTAKTIKESGIECTEVSSFTRFPEIFSGRVKTLHPKIFGGILMRRDEEGDLNEAAENEVYPVDIVCVNLYPFPEVVKREDLDHQAKIENIDIGGPSLIRAAAKNYTHVSVLTDPAQYSGFLRELAEGGISVETRQRLAAAAFSYTSFYDTMIADYFDSQFQLPSDFVRFNKKIESRLRYGENPHQSASIAGDFSDYFEIMHGKELSYNNIVDLVSAAELVSELPPFSCAIIKHTNPCGAALGDSSVEAYQAALSCDPVSAFGGIVAFNKLVDKPTAEKLNEIFLEIIIAPGYEADALELLFKKKNRRILKVKKVKKPYIQIKSVPGGFLLQDSDASSIDKDSVKTVTARRPTAKEFTDLLFAWTVCKHTKSNAIVYVKDGKAVGVGAGQMSRIDSAKIAAMKAKEFGHDLNGAVAASDAFFPFPDGLLEIASHGIKAVIQPGGSVRDDEVIKAAEDKDLSMLFTGIRNFKH